MTRQFPKWRKARRLRHSPFHWWAVGTVRESVIYYFLCGTNERSRIYRNNAADARRNFADERAYGAGTKPHCAPQNRNRCHAGRNPAPQSRNTRRFGTYGRDDIIMFKEAVEFGKQVVGLTRDVQRNKTDTAKLGEEVKDLRQEVN